MAPWRTLCDPARRTSPGAAALDHDLIGAIAAGCAVTALALLPFAARASVRAPIPHPDAPFLRDARWRWGILAWEALRAAVAGSAAIVAIALGLPIVAGLAAGVAPSLWVRAKAEAARDRARLAMTALIRMVEATLRSGVALPEALRRAVEAADDPIARAPFADALRAFGSGAALDRALTQAAQAADARTALALEALALGVGERLPRERIVGVVSGVAERLEFEERLDAEVRARAGGARAQVRLLAVLVPALALYLAVTMPILREVLDAPVGRTLLIPTAVAFECAGIVLSRRIVRQALR